MKLQYIDPGSLLKYASVDDSVGNRHRAKSKILRSSLGESPLNFSDPRISRRFCDRPRVVLGLPLRHHP